ncbi:MAG: hypothetical protein ACK4FB_08855 [Brevundimonas sp.]|uniref:hypothetical protein n=1 Tax=Brevundimonas sp. TaxID=1871086 RepID=UPI003918AA69
MTVKPEPKLIARQQIMHYVLSFCLSRQYDVAKAEEEQGGQKYAGLDAFVGGGFGDAQVQVGDLVVLSSAPPSKWIIGWLVETRETNPGWPEYLIESLEDGALCWWHNVGLSYLPRRLVALHPEWRWTDRQWAFKHRWWKVCYGEKDAYIVRPLMPEFGAGFEVTLGTRTSHGWDDIRPTRSFPDWRKVTKAMMAAAYDECVAEREAIRIQREAEAAA